MAPYKLRLQKRIIQGALLGCCLIVLSSVSLVAQQPSPSCEERLSQLQARFELVAIGREQGEGVAGTALGQLRANVIALEAQLKSLQAENVQLKTTNAALEIKAPHADETDRAKSIISEPGK